MMNELTCFEVIHYKPYFINIFKKLRRIVALKLLYLTAYFFPLQTFSLKNTSFFGFKDHLHRFLDK